MTIERKRRLFLLLREVQDLSSEQYDDFIAEHCSDDAALASELRQLLAAESGPALIDRLATDVVADLRTQDGETFAPGSTIDSWRIVRAIGQGGMGTVWLADRSDGEFEQRVAIKQVIYPTPGLLQRFRQERQILASLDHPNIARLLDGGVGAANLPYFAMEYVDGKPITQDVVERKLDIPATLNLFLQVCNAVQYAHRNLVVHRDLKPSNILVTPDGVPKLLDFGIAKLMQSSDVDEQTHSATRIFTPDYAAPEQIRGGAITTATDVYALGGVLYELLAGVRPYTRISKDVPLEQAILTLDPPPPSSVLTKTTDSANPRVRRLRGDLDRIVLTAMAKESERRYASVDALATDLRRHLDGRPIAALRDSAIYRLRKFILRNRVGVAAAAIVATALIGATTISLWQARLAAEQRDLVQIERDTAQRELDRTTSITDFLLSLLGGAAPNNEAVHVSDLLAGTGERLLRDTNLRPEQQAALISVLADIFRQRRDPQGTENLLLPLLKEQGQTLPVDVFARAACSLGGAERVLGHFAEAKQWIERGLDRSTALIGSARGEHAACLSAQAFLLFDAGNDIENALKLQQRALAEVDPDNRAVTDIASTMHDNYGSLLQLSTHLTEARTEHQRAFDILALLHRSNTADAAVALAEIAGCDRSLGFLARGAQERAQANALRLRVSGPSAGLAQQLINNAGDMIELADPKAALALLDQAETMQRAFVGPESMHFAQLAMQRGRTYAALGQREQAQAQFARTHVLFDKLLPPMHQMREDLRAYEAYAEFDANGGVEQARKALSMFATEETNLQALGKAGKLTLPTALRDEAEAAFATGDLDLAQSKASQARMMYEQSSRPDGWQLAVCDAVLAQIQLRHGEREAAHRLLESAAARLENALGAQHPRAIKTRILATQTSKA